MTAVSSRFLIPLTGLLLVAAVPVVEAVVAPDYVDDCANPAMLFDPLAIDANSVDVEHSTPRIHRGEAVTGTIQPTLRRHAPLQFEISRLWGLPNLLLNPANAAKMEPDRHEIEWVDVDGEKLPIHLSFQTIERGMRMVAYMYAYQNHPVTGAFLTRLRESPHELISGARPLTLLMVSATTGRLYRRETERRAKEWIVAAWKHHRAACGG